MRPNLIKSLAAALLMLVSHSAGAAVAYVGSNTWSNFASDTSGGPSATPGSGQDLIMVVETFTSGATVTGISDASCPSGQLVTDLAFAVDPTNNIGFGVYRCHNATNTSQNITVTFGGSTDYNAWNVVASGVGAYGTATAVLSGSSTALSTNSLTPSQNGAMLLAVGGTNGAATIGTWSNGFADMGGISPGPSAYASYLDQATAAAVSTGATLSASNGWSSILLDYVPSASATCTHAGLTSAGAITVPIAGSTVVRLKNGSFGTVDCSTTSYFQPTIGNFGVN